VRYRSGTRRGIGSSRRVDMHCACHPSKAVQSAEVRKSAGLCKSVLVNSACIGKDSCVAIHVVRRTKFAIGSARGAAGNTVVIAAPGPSHCVAHRNGDRVGDKAYFVSLRSYRYIENLATGRASTTLYRPAVLIYDPDACTGVPYRYGTTRALIARLNWRQECHYKKNCQPARTTRVCI